MGGPMGAGEYSGGYWISTSVNYIVRVVFQHADVHWQSASSTAGKQPVVGLAYTATQVNLPLAEISMTKARSPAAADDATSG